tara:strand:- start:56 stop:889 length:834 start_codon:yes stop_codon:yes gene_type:complete
VTTKLPDNIMFIKWPTDNVLAFTTNRLPSPSPLSVRKSQYLLSSTANTQDEHSAFSAFNLGDHVGDCAEDVAFNRISLLQYLPKQTKIQWFEQVHGNHVAEILDYENKTIIADAAITRNKHIALAIMTADCLPILLSNQEGSEVAAIHGGWRPLSTNIIEQTIAQMHSSPSDIIAWMGPCIGAKKFEVGQAVKQTFCEIYTPFSAAFSPCESVTSDSKTPKYWADLQLIAKLQLLTLGVNNIIQLSECTYSNQTKYYSYRRDKKTGRMASVICLNPT